MNLHQKSKQNIFRFSPNTLSTIVLFLIVLSVDQFFFVKGDAAPLPEGINVGAPSENDEEDIEDGKPHFLANGAPKVKITGISPSHGPLKGDTKVTVRGGPFSGFEKLYPEPKCRFGSDESIVPATYVQCPYAAPKQTEHKSKTQKQSARTQVCLQCEASPPVQESKPVEFTVSLRGDFQDVSSALEYYYFNAPMVISLKPTHGPKDGGTTVQVWGANFRDFGDDTTCSFGTKSVPAKVHDSGYITCETPDSDVVQRPMPFSISLNGQQQTTDRLEFWYYNDAQVTVVDPNLGPEHGGNLIELKGENFLPFRPELGDIDISNSSFCFFKALNVYMKATIVNSTKATCRAPESYYYKETPVELTLNMVDITDDNTMYNYYKPPFLFDSQPEQGPVSGNTKVKVVGSNFSNTGNITCKFGKIQVKGKYLSSSEILCLSPPVESPGFVDLTISMIPGLDSAAVQYLYYKTPVVEEVTPKCGPFSGFTQIIVTGSNFVDLGFNQAVCVFNKTKMTNATVLSDTQILCDTPSILNKQGYPDVPDVTHAFYSVEVSIDGGNEMSLTSANFLFYEQPKILSISPQLGPLTGGTQVTIKGTGFNTNAMCRRMVRVGYINVEPTAFSNDTLIFVAPRVTEANTATISVAGNAQQFTSQPAQHNPSKQITYDYYPAPYISLYYPNSGPTNGGTQMIVQGYGFALARAHLKDRLWSRFVDPKTQQIFGGPKEIHQKYLSKDTFKWSTPSVNQVGDALMQISLNDQDWHDVRDPNIDGGGFTYYLSPHVTAIDPSFGHVKATNIQEIQITGTGFACLDDGCPDLNCRFGNDPTSYIYVKAKYDSPEKLICKVPEYTKPDVLNVEITNNGESYTNDNKTYGFFDPFVIDAVPKLIAVDGSTFVSVKGIGFVNSGTTQASFNNRTHPLTCTDQNQNCYKNAKFVDAHTLITPTYPQADTKYQESGNSVMWDPIYLDATVIGEEFTENQVEVFYYADPTVSRSNIIESPANLQSQLLIPIDLKNNNKELILRLGNPTCRFSAGQKVFITPGKFVAVPFTIQRNPDLINTIHCASPIWPLDNADSEKSNLEVSINGQNFIGSQDFTFLKALKLFRDVPMAGSNSKQTNVKLLGQGFKGGHSERRPQMKWGLETTDEISVDQVSDFTYKTEDFLNLIQGAQELRAYQGETSRFAKFDALIKEGQTLDEMTKRSLFTSNDQVTLEGPAYLQVGYNANSTFKQAQVGDGSIGLENKGQIIYTYENSPVEYYTYRDPDVQGMHPTSGLTKGGTYVEVVGLWFKYMPEYGIVPHCRFGDKIVRGHFDSTVRIVCQSPPNSDTSSRLPFEVSLNGVDWSATGLLFSYYEQPIMTDITPDMGSVNGGEDVFVKGEKFSNNTDPNEFKCKFSPTTLQIPPKIVRAKFINSTTIVCVSPGGWSEADKVILSVTWNDVDYDENNFVYSFYSINRAFPRSGPSNGLGGDIIISGQGFRADTNPSCKLNNTQYDPILISPTEIRCPMPAAEGGDSYFGNVDLAVSANGITWQNFEGGFQYYEQPIVEDIDPKEGPNNGVGIINFYGQNFRADYPLAELGCKIGVNSTGKAYYVSPRQIKCVVEDIPLITEDEDGLPASVSLNSYSYTDSDDNTVYRPYGITMITPNSGPVGGMTTIIVEGQGFVAEEGIRPRCKFGTSANFAIVEAEILSYTRLACRTPEFLPLTPTASLPRDVPFSIAISGDEFNPWTQTYQRFRFYEQPKVVKIEPESVDVGSIKEVYISASEDSEFFEPMGSSFTPKKQGQESEKSSNDGTQTNVEVNGATGNNPGLSLIRCKFGRFGFSPAVYINSTHLKCTTAIGDDQPEDIYREVVKVSVAMNGQDFLEDQSELEFTYIGTAPYISFAAIIFTLLALAFVGFTFILCLENKSYLDQVRNTLNMPVSNRGQRANLDHLRNPAGFQDDQ